MNNFSELNSRINKLKCRVRNFANNVDTNYVVYDKKTLEFIDGPFESYDMAKDALLNYEDNYNFRVGWINNNNTKEIYTIDARGNIGDKIKNFVGNDYRRPSIDKISESQLKSNLDRDLPHSSHILDNIKSSLNSELSGIFGKNTMYYNIAQSYKESNGLQKLLDDCILGNKSAIDLLKELLYRSVLSPYLDR